MSDETRRRNAVLDGPDYWNSEIREARTGSDDAIWYSYMGELYRDLIDRSVSETAEGPSLKTDLYEEARGTQTPFARLPHPLVGIDLSPEIVEAARRNAEDQGLDCDLVVGDVRELPFPDETFQCVLSGSTLDHFTRLDDIYTSLRELGRVLKPGGVLILTLDNPHNPILSLRGSFARLSQFRLRPYFVGATLDRIEGAAALEAAGLEVRSVRAVAHVPRDPAMRLARLRDRLSGGPSYRSFVKALMSFEALERAPSRWRTGYYLAFEAIKPQVLAKGTNASSSDA